MGTSGTYIPLLTGDARPHLTAKRTKSQRMQPHMDQCLSQFTSAATRQQSPLQPVKTTFILCTYLLETFITVFDVPISVGLSFSLFYPFQEVSILHDSGASSIVKSYVIGNRKDGTNLLFRKFRRQLIHGSLSKILSSLRKYMKKFDIVHCADYHFRRAIYGIGPYITDYPEQALIACIITGWCPW